MSPFITAVIVFTNRFFSPWSLWASSRWWWVDRQAGRYGSLSQDFTLRYIQITPLPPHPFMRRRLIRKTKAEMEKDAKRGRREEVERDGELHRARLLFSLVFFFFFWSPDSLRQEMQQIKQIKEGSKTEAAAADSKKDYFNICRERLSAAQGWCCDSSIIISSGVIWGVIRVPSLAQFWSLLRL